MLGEPGVAHRRGSGVIVGRIMAALGDLRAAEVESAHVEALLVAHAREGVGAPSVNKHRQVVSAIFNHGLRADNAKRWRLPTNPAAATSKRREDAPARLEVFTVEQIEALARTAESGSWRDVRSADDVDEDHQLGELLCVASYTGLRRGELVALRWRDVRWSELVLTVERALSDTVEGLPKSRRARYVRCDGATSQHATPPGFHRCAFTICVTRRARCSRACWTR